MYRLVTILLALCSFLCNSQELIFTHQDSLFGTITPERAWWDLNYYHLDVEVHVKDKTIYGSNLVQYTVLQPHQVMQIELQPPLKIISAQQHNEVLEVEQDGFTYFIHLKEKQIPGNVDSLRITYGGTPKESPNPPWSGGITWRKDTNGKDFIASSCQQDGPSLWWPCKDHPYDEVDSLLISVTVPDHLMDVSNGRLRGVTSRKPGTKTYHWFVENPINHYGVNINIGDYVHFSEEYQGEKGTLDLDYFVLRNNLKKAKKQFTQVKDMLDAFEHWFGPYPFYEDGFKLVEVPYLGMEHQSSVTYGNGYENGYLGRDLSGSGWGMKFDYIIIHEAGHEWFANNITYADVADMWIHESFTTYSENLFLDYHYGKQASAEYVIGMRSQVVNDRPILGIYDVHYSGSRDMYFKGANILHTLRQLVDDDEKWRQMLRGLNTHFYHKTVRSQELINYLDDQIELDLQPFFQQYVKDHRIPIFNYYFENGYLMYRFDNVVEGFHMPVKVWMDGEEIWLSSASSQWNRHATKAESLKIDSNFYIASFEIIQPRDSN